MCHSSALLALVTILSAQSLHRPTAPDYLPASSFGKAFMYVSPAAELWPGGRAFQLMHPLDWLGVAPVLPTDVQRPTFVGTINTRKYPRHNDPGSFVLAEPGGLLDWAPNISSAFAWPNKVFGRRLLLAGAVLYTDISDVARWEPVPLLELAGASADPDSVAYNNNQQRQRWEGLISVNVELSPLIAIGLYAGANQTNISTHYSGEFDVGWIFPIFVALNEKTHQNLSGWEGGMSLGVRHKDRGRSFLTLGWLNADGTKEVEWFDRSPEQVESYSGAGWLLRTGGRYRLGKSTRMTALYQLQRSDGSAMVWDYTGRQDSTIELQDYVSSQPGRYNETISLAFRSTLGDQITIWWGLQYSELEAINEFVFGPPTGVANDPLKPASLKIWRSGLPVGVVVKPGTVLGRWIDIRIGVIGQITHRVETSPFYPYRVTRFSEDALESNWGLGLFPISNAHGYIYFGDLAKQLKNKENISVARLGFEVSF